MEHALNGETNDRVNLDPTVDRESSCKQ